MTATAPFRIDYGANLESAISDIQRVLHGPAQQTSLPLRWTALKLLEGDSVVIARVSALPGGARVVTAANTQRRSSGQSAATTWICLPPISATEPSTRLYAMLCNIPRRRRADTHTTH